MSGTHSPQKRYLPAASFRNGPSATDEKGTALEFPDPPLPLQKGLIGSHNTAVSELGYGIDEGLGVRMPRFSYESRGWTHLHEMPPVYDRDSIAEVPGSREVVGDE